MATPEISTLNRGTGGIETAVGVLELAIIATLDFLGAEWKGAQIREAAQIAFEEYYFIQMAELKQFLTRIKTGHYGKIYGKFTPAVFMEWLGLYMDESLKLRAQNAEIQAADERYAERWAAHDKERRAVAALNSPDATAKRQADIDKIMTDFKSKMSANNEQ